MEFYDEFYAGLYASFRRSAAAVAAVLLRRQRWLCVALALTVCVWFACLPNTTTRYIETRDSVLFIGAFAVYYIAIVFFITSFVDQTATAKD